MSSALDNLLDAAMKLRPEERVTLVFLLLESVTPGLSDGNILTDELKRELDRRIDHYSDHPDELISIEDAHTRIRELMDARRKT